LHGETDSEVYFAHLMRHLGSEPDPVQALRAGVSAAIVAGAHTGLNFLLTDGQVMYALHSSTEPDRHSLYLAEMPGVTVVASEPLGIASWTEIPDGWLAILTREGHSMVRLVPPGAVIE
jgi:predicted glutamine amidotransferase